MVVPPETEDHLAPLIQSLVLGFETLLKTVHDQRQKEKVLRERLDFAANEVPLTAFYFAQFLSYHDENHLISSRSRVALAAMSDICMYYLNLQFSLLLLDPISTSSTDICIPVRENHSRRWQCNARISGLQRSSQTSTSAGR